MVVVVVVVAATPNYRRLASQNLGKYLCVLVLLLRLAVGNLSWRLCRNLPTRYSRARRHASVPRGLVQRACPSPGHCSQPHAAHDAHLDVVLDRT